MIDVIEEPRGETYQSLLSFAEEQCSSFSLVWQEGMKFDVSASDIHMSLSSFLIAENQTNTWPGTRLFSHNALVRKYSIVPDSISVLRGVDGLYSWVGPQLPEDLAFYTSDSLCWLGSIAHERDAFFESVALTEEAICDNVRGIKVRS